MPEDKTSTSGQAPAEKRKNDWIDGKPHTVTAETFDIFSRIKKRFCCLMCDKNFKVGDSYRWVYCNGTPGQHTGNFFTCLNCDGADVKERAQRDYETYRKYEKRFNRG